MLRHDFTLRQNRFARKRHRPDAHGGVEPVDTALMADELLPHGSTPE